MWCELIESTCMYVHRVQYIHTIEYGISVLPQVEYDINCMYNTYIYIVISFRANIKKKHQKCRVHIILKERF